MMINRPVFIFKHKSMATFVFDNAPSHKKCPEDALKVENMNIPPGGIQREVGLKCQTVS